MTEKAGNFLQAVLQVLFALWLMTLHSVEELLRCADPAVADKLTEAWADTKLAELNFVGTAVRLSCPKETTLNVLLTDMALE